MLKFKLADPFKVNTPDPIEVGGRIDEEDGSFMLTFNGETVIVYIHHDVTHLNG